MVFDRKRFDDAHAAGDAATQTDMLCDLLARGPVDELKKQTCFLGEALEAMETSLDITRLFDAALSAADANTVTFRYWTLYSSLPSSIKASAVTHTLAHGAASKERLAQLLVAMTYSAAPELIDVVMGQEIEYFAAQGERLICLT